MNDKDSPIDWEKGKEYYGGDEETLFDMIKEYEPLTFDKNVQDVYISYKSKDWAQLIHWAHTLKGSSGWIGAVGMSEACLELQIEAEKLQKQNNLQEQRIKENYLKFMEEAKKLKTYLSKVLQKPLDIKAINQYYEEFKKSPKSAYVSMKTDEEYQAESHRQKDNQNQQNIKKKIGKAEFTNQKSNIDDINIQLETKIPTNNSNTQLQQKNNDQREIKVEGQTQIENCKCCYIF